MIFQFECEFKMFSEWKLFTIIIIIFTFQYSLAARISNFQAKTKKFGPFFRSPFYHVDQSHVQIIDIGNLPEVFTKTQRILEHGVELIEIPIGTTLHKAMKIPPSGVPSQTDIFNTYASKNTWVTNLNGAKQYMNLNYGDIVNFEVIQNLKLFDISVISNWQIIWSRMNDQLEKLRTIKFPLHVSFYARRYIQQKIDHLLFQQKMIQLTVGYGITWEEQQKLLLQYGDVITNDFTYHPQDEIKKQNSHPNDWFSINKKATVLKSRMNTYGWRNEDLNRVSFTTLLDTIMADTITEYVNVDGYYSGKFPSLYHENGFQLEEIAIHVPRDKLIILDTKCQKNFYPCRSKCYNPQRQECLPGGLLLYY